MRSLAERVDAALDALGRFLLALGRLLVDLAVFGVTIAAVGGGATWLGYSVDSILGTAPRDAGVVGQSGPFAMLGLICGFAGSLFAVNWLVGREQRRRR